MEYHAKWMLVAGLILVLMALSDKGLVSAQTFCTKDTCPPGPVVAYFQYSNCTGDVVYEPADVEPRCINGTMISQHIVLTEDYYEQIIYINDGQCGVEAPNAAYQGVRTYFGVCSGLFLGSKRVDSKLMDFTSNFPDNYFSSISSWARGSLQVGSAMTIEGSMMLLNVNATFNAPQEPSSLPEGTYPSYTSSLVTAPCYSPNNCSLDGNEALMWFTHDTNDTCVEHGGSDFYGNVTSGTCYEENDFYTRLHCGNEHTFIQDYMFGNGCERTALSFFFSFQCGPGFTTSVHCTAPPLFAPSIPPPPVSQSPNTLVTTSFILAIIIPFLAFSL